MTGKETESKLKKLPARTLMLLGAIALAGGAPGILLLKGAESGWAWIVRYVASFAAAGGVVLLLSGLLRRSKEKEREVFLAGIDSRKEELVGNMLLEQREGRNPVRWLSDHDIHDPEIRAILLEAMKQRLQASSDPRKQTGA